MKVLVIIVTYNAKKWADDCFGCLMKSTIPCDAFVVDNGSDDGTQEYIRSRYPEIHFVQSQNNLGFGKANNLGFRYALENGYDYCYLLNQDAWFFPDTLDVLIRVSKKQKEYGILSPIQMQKNLLKMDCNFQDDAVSNENFINDLLNKSACDIYPVEKVMAAHWLVPIETVRTVGVFSPAFPHYGEDDNFCDRVTYHGLKIGIVPQARAVHDRELRINSREKEIYLSYVHNIARLSFVKHTVKHPFLQVAKFSLKICLEQRTFKGLWDFMILLLRYKKIKTYREMSKKTGAFL